MSWEELQQKIEHARDLTDRKRSDALVSFRSVGELLTEHARKTPDKIWMIFYDKDGNRSELTYSQFLRSVLVRVRTLLDNGIVPGDRVATFTGNYPETVVSYFACWYLGVTVVPLNVKEDEELLRYVLQNSLSKLIFTRPEFRSRLDTIISEDSNLSSIQILEELIDADPGDVEQLRSWMSGVTHTTEALIVYTSGTTGNPKGVMLDQYNLLIDATALAECHQIDSDSRMMCVLPIHHVNGTVVTLVTPLIAHSSVVLNERFSVHNFFIRLAAESVKVVSAVPTLLAFLLEANISTDNLDLTRLHHIICGAGPLTVDLVMRFEKRFNIPIAHGYGLSETTCYSCCLPVDLSTETRQKWLSQFGYPSIGAAFPVNEMAIHDPDGNPLSADERGEIVIRGHNVMMSYFANEKANQEAFAHGWFRSGDEGFWLEGEDGEPYYFITGRIKELIIRGGVNIATLEIDEVLMSIPGVKAGIAVGFQHDLYGEEVGAYVTPDGTREISEADVIRICRKNLPYFKCPKVVLFGDEMPVTSTGKYQRNKLKPKFAQWQDARFSDSK